MRDANSRAVTLLSLIQRVFLSRVTIAVCTQGVAGIATREEDALRAGILHEPVNEIDGRVGLAGTGRYWDERSRPASGENPIEGRDGLVCAADRR